VPPQPRQPGTPSRAAGLNGAQDRLQPSRRVARFWAAAPDGRSYDEAEPGRLRGQGILDPEDGPNVLVEAGRAAVFRLEPKLKIVKYRVHLNLRCQAAGTTAAG